MVITITINEVLRDVLSKFQAVYEKYYKEIDTDVITPDLMKYVHFENEDELLDFLYDEAPMEIFGQAKESEHNVITHLVDLYKSMPSDYKLRLVSDDFGRAKASTLWFLAKYGCCMDEIRFYSSSQIESLWLDSDVIITADVDIIKSKPDNKKLIVIDRVYNEDLKGDTRIKNLKQLNSFETTYEEIR